MHSARATLRHPAPIFCPGKAEMFADHPKQRSGRIDVEIGTFFVNREGDHCSSPDLSLASSRKRRQVATHRFYIVEGRRLASLAMDHIFFVLSRAHQKRAALDDLIESDENHALRVTVTIRRSHEKVCLGEVGSSTRSEEHTSELQSLRHLV